LERPHYVSDLDCHLYAVYADDCARAGNHREGIQSLRILVNKNPDFIAGWLQLATLLIETGQLKQALGTLKKLTTLHPRYREGQITFQNLLKKYACQRFAFFSPLPTDNKPSKNERSKDTSDHTTKDFSLR
jgi:tetratricopeptide (TPR) repeat protein